MKKLMVILITGLLYMSCTDSMEVSGDADRNNTEDVSVRLVITIPASTTYARTRGTFATTDHESKISEIQVLVFEEGKYKYRVPGISINNTSSAASFKTLLKSSSSPLKLLILANATDAVIANEPSVDDSEDLVKKNINLRFNNITSDFPMYGEYELPGGLEATVINNITGIKMLRSIARVDVKATEVANFKLSGVKAYRANDHLQIIPDETGVVRVTLPSVPAGSSGNVNSILYPVPAENLNEFSAQLYLPEADSPTPDNRVSQATCIVVEGYYEGSDQPGYYRMDFDPDNVENAFGQVLRNHKYIFNIKKVSGPGWGSPDEAANNRSAHIVAEIQAWDDYTIDMNFDGEHHFGVSTREIVLKNKAGSGSAEARATGLRGILNNQNNFGPTGTVECGGYNLIGVNANYNNLTDALFASFDVVYVHYMGNLLFGTSDAQKAHNWVKSKKNRVLIVSYDALDVSQNLLKEILGGNNGISFLTSNTGPYPLATPENGNSYFSTTGPFTSAPYTPINTDFSLRNYDAYHGEIQLNTEASKGITPILMGPAGGIVLGIDYSRRIVYWGDTDIGSSASSSTSTTDNRINNNSGTINNNASKLIANVFAWIVETVLYGE